MTRPCFEIAVKSNSFHCDCCGRVSSAEASFLLPGGAAAEFIHDGHFGNGAWNGEEWQLRLFALGLLGILPRVDGADADMPCVLGPPDETGSPVAIPAHKSRAEGFTPLDIQIEWRDGIDGSREPLRARWAARGESFIHEMETEASDDNLWIAVSDSLIDFEIDREEETEDHDGFDDCEEDEDYDDLDDCEEDEDYEDYDD